jgi:hypothetical protein
MEVEGLFRVEGLSRVEGLFRIEGLFRDERVFVVEGLKGSSRMKGSLYTIHEVGKQHSVAVMMLRRGGCERQPAGSHPLVHLNPGVGSPLRSSPLVPVVMSVKACLFW